MKIDIVNCVCHVNKSRKGSNPSIHLLSLLILHSESQVQLPIPAMLEQDHVQPGQAGNTEPSFISIVTNNTHID